jgi:hypothetical protein
MKGAECLEQLDKCLSRRILRYGTGLYDVPHFLWTLEARDCNPFALSLLFLPNVPPKIFFLISLLRASLISSVALVTVIWC